MPKHPFLDNPHKRKAQLAQMHKGLGKRFEKLYRYYVVAKKRNYSPETVFTTVENLNALITRVENNEKWLETLPPKPKSQL